MSETNPQKQLTLEQLAQEQLKIIEWFNGLTRDQQKRLIEMLLFPANGRFSVRDCNGECETQADERCCQMCVYRHFSKAEKAENVKKLFDSLPEEWRICLKAVSPIVYNVRRCPKPYIVHRNVVIDALITQIFNILGMEIVNVSGNRCIQLKQESNIAVVPADRSTAVVPVSPRK